ncbi:phosphopentomutase [Pectobacterium carotovorum]|uniref:Phosphopentomutase n=1 Tax=Pectobacterium carotovorum subsp. carotovorum TaxID=555 RepID=A0AAI9KZ25_PECCC|nr:phosphopentomutase [Pectobacterium carotovorum]KHS85560.1 phosphopentomutase [Pectobacterium carotovorum subsp. carotovorum]KHT32082.1 phosphopentomutase [Pectobacterium carotovorum subsp. carotovorum]MBA0177247.1 phosphopentomutase [Pectobacterium carotovorum]MBA0179485.1 phosphopentomutase [Pectobacterium carotovorum]MCA6972684.1 phosphopentomutase [Pectobacterium carotovorum]
MKRAYIMVLDSFGIGSSADAERFGDVGSDTLGHIAQACAAGTADKGRSGKLHLPNLSRLGLGKAAEASTGTFPAGLDENADIIGAYAHASEISSGKDTPSGHWEIAGVPVLFDWGYFKDEENSFPQELLDKLVKRANLPGYLGNCHSSGTVILDQLAEEHMKTGKPIFYTSADSVFQIACHEETFGLDKLYELCEIAREELTEGNYNIGRVIARPFIGDKPGNFERTGNRHDLAVEPPAPTILKKMVDEKGGEVVSVGKIADIYAQVGITKKVKATGIDALFDATLKEMDSAGDNTIVFTNFVDFDSAYGHRRDIPGYAAALELFDRRLPEMLSRVKGDDILILTADHGCDPSWHGTDHTRENVPVLIYGPNVKPGSYGHRETFADIGQTVATYFGLSPMDYGKSIL